MREHLPVVLSPLLDIDNEYLLQPEGVLYQDVPFAYTGNLSIGPIGPEILEIEPVVRVDQYVLLSLDSENFCRELCLTTPNVQKTE